MPIPASRDRLSRPVDISTLLDKAPRRVNIMVDEPGLRRAGLSGYGFRNGPGNGGAGRGGSTGSPAGVQRGGIGQGRNQQRAVVVVRDTRTPGTTGARRGGGRGRRQLPSWYPRTPIRDITGIMRAIESRRAELGLNQDTEAQQEDNNNAEPGNTQREPEIGAMTPMPMITIKPQSSPASQMWKMKAVNADWTVDSSEFLTPEKKLLNSIEKVREAWLEDQRKLERTPAAKRTERDNKVRVLMSMR